ncbi:MAG: hypothetical protein HOJ65_13405 [Verrucomicrobia bacterium]|nr:hypothetical protein [Verrucomicrobiota bacterium]
MAVVALGMLSVSAEIAWSAENPYLAISERNAFNLTSEPPPTRETAPPEPPRSEDIMLTGIYLHKGVERVALARVDTKKKAEPPTYLQLVAGEKKDGIEIVSIDKATGKVTIKEFGELRSLSFKENTFKTSVAKAPRKTSSRSSSSKSSSAAAKKAAEIRASIEKKRAEEAAKRSGGGSERSSRDELRERFANMSDADRQKYAQQMRERFSSQSRGSERSDRGDRGGNSDGRRGRGR